MKAAMPPDVDIGDSWVVEFAAVDSSGADVAGVKVSSCVIEAKNLTGGLNVALESGPFLLVPGPGA